MPPIMSSPPINGWREVSTAINASLQACLVQLAEIRALQIHRWANCLNKHAKEARAIGEAEQRTYLLPTCRAAPYHSEGERAALGWAEALMGLSKAIGSRLMKR